MLGRWLVGGLAAAVLIGSHPLVAQLQRPLTPLPPGGLRVAPFFDGWYQNPDGTATFSFGYSNLNLTDTVEIPVGPDNMIEPAEFNGRQPTTFLPGGGEQVGERPNTRRERERGIFTVTVPAGFRGDVTWTIRHAGQTNRVPASIRTTAYMLRWPMAMGSTPPLLRWSENGPAGRGPVGMEGTPVTTAVGRPVPLTLWLEDDAVREPDPPGVRPRGDGAVMNVIWQKFSGPAGAPVAFEPSKEPIKAAKGSATTTATFSQPGEYVIRTRADTFGRLDTSAGNQCCWTNGYVKVTVTP